MNNLRTETIKINSLSLDPTNARRHDAKNLAAIEGSLKLFGQRKPIVVTGANIVVAGNGTLEAAKSLGWEEITIVRTPIEWTPEQVKAYALADNRTAELAEWDAKVLADQLIELDAVGWDVAEFGFEPIEPPSDSEDDEPLSFDENKPTRSKLGDLWQIGEHRILCGDSLDKYNLDRLIGSLKVDCVLTDPPYGINLDTDYSKTPGGNENSILNRPRKKYKNVIDDDKPFDASFLRTYFNKVNEQFWFGADYYFNTLSANNLDGAWLVWDKRNQDGSQDDVLGSSFELCWSNKKHQRRILRHYWVGAFGDKEARNRFHPTQKPTKMIIEILEKWTKPNQVIVDCFAGSGSTLVAAVKCNRIGLGIELDPFYVDVIIDRLEKETGLEAELLES
jgi:DNA modification methylase